MMGPMRCVVVLALTVGLASLARADVPASDAEASAARARRACEPGWYLEPSFLIAVGLENPAPSFVALPTTFGAFHRLAGGGLIRVCGPDHQSRADLHVGATGVLTWLPVVTQGKSRMLTVPEYGFGLEAELDLPIAPRVRAGVRAGAETYAGGLFTVGGRLRVDRTAWLGIDAFLLRQPSTTVDCASYAVYGCSTRSLGVMAGVGLDGRSAKVDGAIELGLLGAAGLAIVVAELFAGGPR